MPRLLHEIAESIRRRDEPIKTVMTALFGLLVASSVAIAGDWLTMGLAGGGSVRDAATNPVVVLLIAFLWTAASVVLGGYVVARLHNTRGALSTFILLEMMLGAGMIAEFWSPAASWYNTLALLLVIPCALLGAFLVRPVGPYFDYTIPRPGSARANNRH